VGACRVHTWVSGHASQPPGGTRIEEADLGSATTAPIQRGQSIVGWVGTPARRGAVGTMRASGGRLLPFVETGCSQTRRRELVQVSQ
jgi:hypothetical protein